MKWKRKIAGPKKGYLAKARTAHNKRIVPKSSPYKVRTNGRNK
jgi:hypothetical protein